GSERLWRYYPAGLAERFRQENQQGPGKDFQVLAGCESRSDGSLFGSSRGILFGDNARSGGAANNAPSLRSVARLLGRSLKSPTSTPRLSGTDLFDPDGSQLA